MEEIGGLQKPWKGETEMGRRYWHGS